MTRYEKGFIEKCAEYGIGPQYAQKMASYVAPALAMGALGGGYLASRMFNTDAVGGRMPDLPRRPSIGVNNVRRNQKYFGNDTDYTQRRLIVNDLTGAAKGIGKGALLGVPTAIAAALLTRGRGGRLLNSMMSRAVTGRSTQGLQRYAGRLIRNAAGKGLAIGALGGGVIGGGLADANARLRMWEGRDPTLDTVALGQV